MNAGIPRFELVGDGPGGERPAGFLVSVLRRIQPRLLPWALVVLGVTDLLARISRTGIEKRYFVPPTHGQAALLTEIVMISCLLLAVLIADEAVARGARRWPTYLGAVLAACIAGCLVQRQLLLLLRWDDLWRDAHDPVASFVQSLGIFLPTWLYGTLACIVYVKLHTAMLAADRLRSAELARAKSRRRTLESQLQAMQARVEPQFLFNTLAQVRELYERDAQVGSRMLEDLIAYLRAALPHLRESSSTIGQEIALARAYLDIMRIRLGEKLTFAIDLREAIESARMPPMMLLPLIDHALACIPAPGDGRRAIDIAIGIRDGRIILTLADSGDAFLPGVHAAGLEGITQRLHALYGDDARFEFERLVAGGTRATLEIPCEAADGSDR